MKDADEIDAMAAEYALGTLDSSERATVAARRLREPALDAAIIAWERRLAPLAETIAPLPPPPGLFAGIEKRLDGAAKSVGEIIDLRRRLRNWRIAAIGSGALAACLAIGLVVGTLIRPPIGEFVAVLQKDAASPAFLIKVDMNTRLLTVRPVAAPREPGHSYELWLVNARLGGPKSLGLLDERAVSLHRASTIDKSVIEDATYAVSLEPEGGSTTGAPTGPVLFTGKLIPSPI